MLNVLVAVQLFASVTVTVYTCAVRPDTLPVPSPDGLPGVQLYVRVPVPPLAVTCAAPLDPLKHDTLVWEIGVITIAGGCVMLNVLVIDVAAASVMVTV